MPVLSITVHDMPASDQAVDFENVLPIPLGERTRVLRSGPPGRGRFVLYWMHHTVRGHENPALDAAITLGAHYDLPVVAYQGLGGAHRYNNDRHYQFILEGARDAHREIATRGIKTVFNLATDPYAASPLPALAQSAAFLVLEDYPAPPFPNWMRRLVERSDCPVLAVDGSCVVPMRLQPTRFKRAFEFRRQNEGEYVQRLSTPWIDADAGLPPFDAELPFEPLDLLTADFMALCASCRIDHSVPPVSDTCGGSQAGYARWERFRREGLRHYAYKRNDAALEWPQGVSRLSPYLHHGHVSPLRIAREAAAVGGKGAEKFLDELLVWRELAFNFCFHTPDPESLACLPAWARDTLLEHGEDPRAALFDSETLARSGTGDALWDLAQASLRIHGELHNNLRMTWAKAIPQWRADPQQALKTLVDLNHRYALDGSDPNSYGGLLWALGLFDRPFPEQAVTGRLRTRSTEAHASRLDIARYRARVTRPSSGPALQVAVVGAGVSGLAAARTLQDQGHHVRVFEKSRGTGGRAATRRYDTIGFDHGAQYFTARDTDFCTAVEAWQEAGVVAGWSARMATYADGRLSTSPDQQARYVAVPGMNALGKHLASDLAVHRETTVAPPAFVDGRWQLDDADGRDLGNFDALVVAAPAPQAAALLHDSAPALAATAEDIVYDPMWAVMLLVDAEDPLGVDGLFVKDGPIGWAARNHSKPGRQGKAWVVHATAEWTRHHLEMPADEVAASLADAFAELLGDQSIGVTPIGAHRWLYSLVANPLHQGALWDPDRHLAVCGDWCQGARIEGAYLSGIAAAGRLLGFLDQRAKSQRPLE